MADEYHFDWVAREKRGEVLARDIEKGAPHGHITEVRQHRKHLADIADRLETIIQSNEYRVVPWSPEAIEYLSQVLRQVTDAIKAMDKALGQ